MAGLRAEQRGAVGQGPRFSQPSTTRTVHQPCIYYNDAGQLTHAGVADSTPQPIAIEDSPSVFAIGGGEVGEAESEDTIGTNQDEGTGGSNTGHSAGEDTSIETEWQLAEHHLEGAKLSTPISSSASLH